MIDLQKSLLDNPKGLKLHLLNKIFALKLPFNRSHKITILENTPNVKTLVLLPNIKNNHNHLNGLHACALATAGEFAAGVFILGFVNTKTHRLIMSQMHVDYVYRAQENILAECSVIDSEENKMALLKLQEESVVKSVELITKLTNQSNNQAVAIVKTTWQIKDWKAVR